MKVLFGLGIPTVATIAMVIVVRIIAWAVERLMK
jgi:hypothetical protein